MNIVFLDEGTLFNVPNLSLLHTIGTYQGYYHTPFSHVAERLYDADIAITNKVVINKQVMDSCPRLKLLCVAATGMNNVDLEAAKAHNIVVKNVSGYSTPSVVQVAWGMILHLLNQINYYDEYVKNGHYAKNEFFTHVGTPFYELKNKKLGIIGLGTIGHQMALVAQVFGMQVCYTSISGSNRPEPYDRLPLEQLLATCDVVTIHTPLNEASKNLISIEKLKRMPPHAILINAGRGGIVVETDLAYALEHHFIAGAGIDVFSVEPINHDNPLLRPEISSKVVLAPHVAWASVEARMRLVEEVANNITAYLAAND